MSNEKHILLTVREVSDLLRIKRPKVYDLIRDRTISGFKIGADWRVTRESIEKLVGEIPQEFFLRDESRALALSQRKAA